MRKRPVSLSAKNFKYDMVLWNTVFFFNDKKIFSRLGQCFRVWPLEVHYYPVSSTHTEYPFLLFP